MKKYTEKKFKEYLMAIEDMNRDMRYFSDDADMDEITRIYKELKKTRIAFYNWFKKQVK